MKKVSYNILPATEEILKTMGEQIKLARLRRNLTVELVAERAGISRASLWNVKKGNMAVSNTDDHLRNHAFILKKSGWALSPLYDVNPVPYGDELSLNVNEDDNRISIPLAIETAHRFGIKEEDAIIFAKEIIEIVKNNWEKLATKYGIPRGKIEDMKPAFSACYEDEN